MRTAARVETVRSVLDLEAMESQEHSVRWPVLLAELVVVVQLLVVVVDSDLRMPGILVPVAIVGLLSAVALGLTLLGGDAPSGAGMLLAGSAGVAAGAGTAASRVYALELSAETAIGLLALVAGAGLLVVGSYRLLRATPGWWRLLGLPVAFLVVQFALLPPAYAVHGTHIARVASHASPPGGAVAVSLLTDDGVSLSGWYTPSRNGAAIVVLHGAGGTKADVAAQAAVLARHGYGVLAFDASGGGASGGSPMAWGWNGNRDIAAAVSYLVARDEVEAARIGVLGESMGGEQAITAAAADARIRAVVAEGASARTAADIEYLPTDPGGVIQRFYYAVMWGIADALTEASPPIPLRDAVRDMRQPLLLITSSDPNDAAAAPFLSEAAPPTFARWDPPDTGHTQALAVHPEEWERRVIGFFDGALR